MRTLEVTYDTLAAINASTGQAVTLQYDCSPSEENLKRKNSEAALVTRHFVQRFCNTVGSATIVRAFCGKTKQNQEIVQSKDASLHGAAQQRPPVAWLVVKSWRCFRSRHPDVAHEITAHLHAGLALALQAIGCALIAVELIRRLLDVALAALLALDRRHFCHWQRLPDALLAPTKHAE